LEKFEVYKPDERSNQVVKEWLTVITTSRGSACGAGRKWWRWFVTQLVELAKKIALFAAEQQISVPTENQQTLSSPHGGTESVMSIHTHVFVSSLVHTRQ